MALPDILTVLGWSSLSSSILRQGSGDHVVIWLSKDVWDWLCSSVQVGVFIRKMKSCVVLKSIFTLIGEQNTIVLYNIYPSQILTASAWQKGSFSHPWVYRVLWSPTPNFLNTGNHLVWMIPQHNDNQLTLIAIMGHGIYFGYNKYHIIKIQSDYFSRIPEVLDVSSSIPESTLSTFSLEGFSTRFLIFSMGTYFNLLKP